MLVVLSLTASAIGIASLVFGRNGQIFALATLAGAGFALAAQRRGASLRQSTRRLVVIALVVNCAMLLALTPLLWFYLGSG